MKIYCLTSVGSSIASNPSHNSSLAMRILYTLRRHGGQGSDEYLQDQLQASGNEMNNALKTLLDNNAVRVVGG